MLNLRRVRAILWQEFFITRRAGDVMADIFIFPFANIIVFGFLSLYLSGENTFMGQQVLMGMLLWNVIWIVQYSVTVGSLWNIWSRNLTNLFISPMRLPEYILAHALSGMIKASIVLGIAAVLSIYVFDFNLFSIGAPAFLLVFMNLSLFAYALGIALLGIIFRYGTRVQAAAWATVSFFQPLSAAFYPLEIMPTALQLLAKLFPATHAFEAARFALANNGALAWNSLGIAFVENVLYGILATLLFAYLYNASRDSGQFARNES